MKRTPSQRLGASGGAAEIKNHEFFKEVNWEKVYNRYKLIKILFIYFFLASKPVEFINHQKLTRICLCWILL
jgi:hypothetical protein